MCSESLIITIIKRINIVVNSYIEIDPDLGADISIREIEGENISSPIVKEPTEKSSRIRPLAQSNIMAPKRTRNNPNLKQTTVRYLEKNENQHALRLRELNLEERKQ
ncbi:uncharacterized protein LOC123322000 [Coccinella septempunctata]|uniref:uncharacterized protein LOC123322000 n=1 Tax=Coccinella septempunctata TaxID=41139 RepID=UPI001D0601B2|nr:uncharacterized protein LOC123322000 [Coccinella septempunctata]